jgi:hypothetical protein
LASPEVAIKETAHTSAVAADATIANFFNVSSKVGPRVRELFCTFRPRATAAS